MSLARFGQVARTLLLIGGILSFVFVTLAEAEEDVYNFYFQKGAAPQTVVQSGSGQQVAQPVGKPIASPTEPSPEAALPASTPAVTNAVVAQPPLRETEPGSRGYKPVTLSLGYGRVNDPVGNGMAYALGLQFNFHRFLGARFQGRYRNLQTGSDEIPVGDAKSTANRLGGMAALAFTPLHLDLLGHRFVELGAYAGGETYRKLDHDRKVSNGFHPIIGLSALLGLNENVGVEVQANRSTKSTYLGANLAFQF